MSLQDARGVAPKLYAAREPVFPRRVQGAFRRLKWWIMAVTLGIYYITPWLRWDRGPNLPDQAVLVDLSGRRFYFFMIEIWPQEFYYVAGLLIMAGLGLFLFTAALGRVWCGYTCPQTVWTDLMILVERWIEGDRNARVRLYRAPYDARKLRLRLTKWLVWALIGLATGGAWVFYFADAPTLARDLVLGTAHPVAYTSIAILTATTVVFGGFMREQVCIYMCPWPRIQAAMMDEDTLTVSYRDWRGEPRGKKHEGRTGDCIDCMACVNVCPMGIDIREGQQLACITCALCIDACDDVMEKTGRPRGLIDYVTLKDEVAAATGALVTPAWRHIVRPRTLVYFTLWAGIGVAMVVALFLRDSIDLTVAHDRNPLFVQLSEGGIRNSYTLKIANRDGEPRAYFIDVRAPFPVEVTLQGRPGVRVEVPADRIEEVRAFVTALPVRDGQPGVGKDDDDDEDEGRDDDHNDRREIEIWITDTVSREREHAGSFFMGPKS